MQLSIIVGYSKKWLLVGNSRIEKKLKILLLKN